MVTNILFTYQNLTRLKWENPGGGRGLLTDCNPRRLSASAFSLRSDEEFVSKCRANVYYHTKVSEEKPGGGLSADCNRRLPTSAFSLRSDKEFVSECRAGA